MNERKPVVSPPFFASFVIWAFLMAGCVMHSVIAYSVLKNRNEAGSQSGFNEYVMTGFAVLIAALAWQVPKLLSRVKKPSVPLREISDTELVRIGMFGFVLRLAMIEGISLIGFVLAITAGRFEAMWPFSAAALIGFFLARPNRESLENLF